MYIHENEMHEKQFEIRLIHYRFSFHYRRRKESENNLLVGGILASFPAIWWFGWKKLNWRFRGENGDSVAPCHILQ